MPHLETKRNVQSPETVAAMLAYEDDVGWAVTYKTKALLLKKLVWIRYLYRPCFDFVWPRSEEVLELQCLVPMYNDLI
jgi:hypothetical protein